MKKLIYIITAILITGNAFSQVNICCPDFSLKQMGDIMPCHGDSTCARDYHPPYGQNPTGPETITSCKNSVQTYYVFPNQQPGFTYSWTVVGGTPTTFTGNPAIINWGNGTNGTIQVIITDSSGNCRDTITQKVCLLNSPIAAFIVAPATTVCVNQPIPITNTSVGANSYSWNFGNGTGSTLANPLPISYTTPGTYTILLTVSNGSGGSGTAAGNEKPCGCTDTATVVITVLPGIGPTITSSCKKMLCPSDTATYSVSPGCAPYNWTVNGGTIVAGSGTSSITVQWDATAPAILPASVSVTTGCGGVCGSSATLNVPVLWNNMPISGPNPVCVGTAGTYSLPVMPGTFYTWTVSGGGGTIVGPNQNTATINVQWGAVGSATITCNYNNPHSGCSGSTTMTVNVRPKFNATGPSPVCTGNTGYYSVTDGGLANWTISPGAGYTVGSMTSVTGISVNWTAAGNYTVTATAVNPANYCDSNAVINVVVNPAPVLNPIVGSVIICPNQLYTYTASSNLPGGNYTWNLTSGTGTVSAYGAANSSASVLFTGAGPWTLQATQTVGNCSGSIPLSVTIVPPPPAITLSPGGSICSGGTITATVTGSVPPGGYIWSSTPGAVLLPGGQGTTTATFTVNSNATISISSCGGTSNINVTTTAATVSITPVLGTCDATLTALPVGGTYQWFLNGNPYPGVGNVITVTQNGNYVVQATYGACQAVDLIVVTGITPVVTTITYMGSICNNGSVILTASVSANCSGATYTWSSLATANFATGNPITVNTPGSYWATVLCNNGCTDVSNTITLSCVEGLGCINDLIISPPSNCPNPVALTTNIPAGCTPTSTAWYYGDGFSGNTGNHLYANVGNYNVYAAMTCADGSVHCDTMIITVPMVDSFTYVISCGSNTWDIQLQDASIYLPAYAGYTRTWSTTCGTLSSTTLPNPTLSVPFGLCNPTVTLTISNLGCTLTKSFTFPFPATPLSIIGPAIVCKGAQNIFSSSYTTGVLSYAWNFGDATSGVTNPITHAFNGIPSNPVITMSITDQWGCIFSATKNITVITPTALTISPSPLIKICPDCTSPVTLSTNPVVGFTNYQWYQNGVAIGGATNPTYQLCNFNASGNYYVTAINSTNNNCPVISDTVQVVYLPKPVADIQGSSVACMSGNSPPYNIFLQNASGNNPNYTYNWTATGPGSVTFSPNNLQFYASASVTQLGTYQFILTVTDITTGCIAKDTFCVYVSKGPNVTVPPATGVLCAGTLHTFTATAIPSNPNYIYQWSNGVTGSTMSTSLPGSYSVTVTDPANGCFAFGFTSMIKPLPYVALFPQGCDTICLGDTSKLRFPLPINTLTGQPTYTIVWSLPGGVGTTFPLSTLGLGSHTITATVTMNGCTVTTAAYNVFVKNCDSCDCKESHWGEITLQSGGATQNLSCDKTYDLKCNQPFTFNAAYNCKDSACTSKVTYSLQPPSGPAITGTMPPAFTYTPTQNGTYTLTMSGWCDTLECNKCVITFVVKCDTIIDCCKGSKWGEKIFTTQNAKKPFDCNTTYDVKCKQSVTLNATYNCTDPNNCPPKVTYSLQPPGAVSPITGTLPLTFTPNQTGIYTVTMYGWCGDKICDSCVVKFKTECIEPPGCCPYEIKAETGTIKYDYVQIPNATLASQTFTLNGLALANITEVRANVISYTIDDNYKKECMKCVNLPFTWASVSSATNIVSVPPMITMYGGATVPLFNGSGAGTYQNPREVVWNNNTTFSIPDGSNIGMSFILPPPSGIDCCELRGRICVKFTFRDKDCKECEVIKCFEFVIKKK